MNRKLNKIFAAHLSFALLCCTTSPILAQKIKQNSVFVEALGNAVGYSVNYDRIIPLSEKIKLAPRVGFEYIPRKLEEYPRYGKWSFPLELNMLYGKNSKSKNFFESGLGLTLFNLVENYERDENGKIVDTKVKMAKVTMLRLGFRHQKPEGGLMYRIGVMGRLSQDKFSYSRVSDDLFYKLWPGFSIGYSF
jgi:hypothetical protein